jgi:ferredoxin
MFFTYGARTAGYAHFHTKMLLEQAGFDVRCSAELLGRHSFNVGGWQVLPDRPDERDFRVAREFVRVVIERVQDDSLKGFDLQKPFGYHHAVKAKQSKAEKTERGWFHPTRVTDECRMCRQCETRCPNQAFDAETGLSDPRRCILCMHCVYICPDKALKLDERVETEAYPDFLADFNLTDAIINAKTSKILTESWHAAQ